MSLTHQAAARNRQWEPRPRQRGTALSARETPPDSDHLQSVSHSQPSGKGTKEKTVSSIFKANEAQRTDQNEAVKRRYAQRAVVRRARARIGHLISFFRHHCRPREYGTKKRIAGSARNVGSYRIKFGLRIEASSRPLAARGLRGTTTFRPGVWQK